MTADTPAGMDEAVVLAARALYLTDYETGREHGFDQCDDDIRDAYRQNARYILTAALPALTAEVERQALESIDAAHLSGDQIALAEAKMRWWWAESERHRRSRDSYRVAVAQARRWVETCVDPIAVGPMRKQAMLDFLDGLRDVPDFERIPQHPTASSSADLDARAAVERVRAMADWFADRPGTVYTAANVARDFRAALGGAAADPAAATGEGTE